MNDIDIFNSTFDELNALNGLYEYALRKQGKAGDKCAILRFQLIQAIAALDWLIHRIVRIRLMHALNGERDLSDYAKNYFSINCTGLLINKGSIEFYLWLQDEISNLFTSDSFQSSSNIRAAMKYITNTDIFKTVSELMGITKEEVIMQLDLIVGRRNSIVHECDFDLANLPVQNSIQRIDITKAMIFIKDLGNSLWIIADTT